MAGNVQERAVRTAREWSQGTISGLDDAMTRRLVASTVMTESHGGRLDVINAQGYCGRYQAGAGWLADAGYIEPERVRTAMKHDGYRSEWDWATSGGMTRFLRDAGNWKDGLSLERYLQSADLQDRAFKTNADKAYRAGLAAHVLDAQTDPRVVAGFLKARHIAGPLGAVNAVRGAAGRSDINGTNNLTYLDHLVHDRDGLDALMGLRANPVSAARPTDSRPQTADGGRVAAPAPVSPLSDGILRHGEHGREIARIQAQLNSHGIRDEHGRALPLTGNYLDRTQAAVASFQRTVGLEATGVADRATLSALARPAEVRYGQHGAAVTHVQKMLRAAGVDLPASGRFDYQTEGAVKDFQLAQGLMPTGVVSDETLYRLRQAERQHIAAPAPAIDRTVEAPASAVRRAVEAPAPATRAVLLSDPTHPDHALFSQALRGVDGLDAAHRRTADERSANAAGALTAAAREAGFERIDHVVLGEGGSRLFAVQGALDSPLKRIAWVDTVQAMTQSLELSTQRVEASMVSMQRMNPDPLTNPPEKEWPSLARLH